jgi:hypothetical protein
VKGYLSNRYKRLQRVCKSYENCNIVQYTYEQYTKLCHYRPYRPR